jgi:hypothetical protein
VDAVKAVISGVVVIGLVTAVGLHGTQLASVIKSGGSATQGLFFTAETGKQ